ncbi:hypothetical protein [Deinococcus cellulosilyticus]|uniref:Uncharacterized protein n=1 Tax=Deinococcus cellulosilyticus (strain DSM 18568 / NBRC 106333 / KACC 11606 / 5516J-15) TaxID=1223518 RepID=A0A511N3L1_DEIC1|nr:hypothetical protein [Deinococcus cellulosilyticus]GEM47460.1 hypothetical protein DC3_30950 [Deinococcus cellulosilyticus NBRC 106333 = KACC 11606]
MNARSKSVVILVAFVLASMLMVGLAQSQQGFNQLVLVVFGAALFTSGVSSFVVLELSREERTLQLKTRNAHP